MDRVYIKKISKKQLNKNFVVLAISYIITGLFMNLPQILDKISYNRILPYKLTILALIIYLLIGKPLYIGLIKMNLDIANDKKIRIKDLLKGFKSVYNIYTTSFALSLLIDILVFPLILIPIVMNNDIIGSFPLIAIIASVSSLFFSVVFSQLDYIIADKEDISPIEAIKKSIIIIKNHAIEYILLDLSFIGWILLSGITLGIAMIWVGPYMYLTYANYYNYIKEGKIEEYKKMRLSLNKSILIGIVVLVMLSIFSIYENKINANILSPKIVRTVIKENSLDLVSTLQTDEYYYLDEDNKYISKIDKKYFGEKLERYLCIVRNHKLDKNNKNVEYTLLEIVADGENIINITTNPYTSDIKNKIDNYNYKEGKYDLVGNLIK